VLSDGAIMIDFGQVPRGREVRFADVLRLTPTDDAGARVTLTLSGPAGQCVRQVGFWDAEHSVVSPDLALLPGQAAQVAFEFDLGSEATCGMQMGALTLHVQHTGGHLEEWTLPLVLTVVHSGVSPSPSCTPSATPSCSLRPKPHETRTPRPTRSRTPRPKPIRTPTS
jgi:hypothetical protein